MLVPKDKKPVPPFAWSDEIAKARYAVGHNMYVHEYDETLGCPDWIWENNPKLLDGISAGKVPCPTCNGHGRKYDPDDPRDPVEGDKLRSRIVCKNCRGSGFSDQQVDYQHYSKFLNQQWGKHEIASAKYKLLLALCEKLQRHLTGEEITLLGEIEEV